MACRAEGVSGAVTLDGQPLVKGTIQFAAYLG